jgi:hypothetical protein
MRRLAPVFVLLLLSPMVGELLSGSTPILSFFKPFSFLLEVGLYGAGAVLIRELVRWNGLGWQRIVLLGAAYGMVEEGLQIQSFFNVHHPDLGNLAVYGRALDVNWVWAEELIGYHAIWSITIPILLTELLFPARSDRPWLGTRGLRVIGIIFCLDVILGFAFFTWLFNHLFGYVTPLIPYLATYELVCALLVLGLRPARPASTTAAPPPVRRAPRPWLLRLFSFFAAFAWFFIFLGLTDPKSSKIPAPVTMLLGGMLALGVWLLVRRWSGPGRLWDDRHRLALATGPLVLLALEAIFIQPSIVSAGRDFAGQPFVGLAAILLLIVFAWRINARIKRAARAAEQARPYPIPPWQTEKTPGPASAHPTPPPQVIYWNGTPTALAWSSGPHTTQADQWGYIP